MHSIWRRSLQKEPARNLNCGRAGGAGVAGRAGTRARSESCALGRRSVFTRSCLPKHRAFAVRARRRAPRRVAKTSRACRREPSDTFDSHRSHNREPELWGAAPSFEALRRWAESTITATDCGFANAHRSTCAGFR